MGVFDKNKGRFKMAPITNQESWKCMNGHDIDGVIPAIDPAKMEVQHPEWIGKECSCRRLIYLEEKCYCPNPENQHWEIHWQPNPNY